MRQPTVSLVIEHRLVEGAAARYEAWLEDIIPAARRFAGHQGVEILRPDAASSRYLLVLRFDTMNHLRAWLDSSERAALIARIEPWLAAEENLQAASGLDYLFASPSARPPPRYKQFLLTLSAIYPLTTIVPFAVRPWLNAMPVLAAGWSGNLIVSAIIVFLMVYVVMPRYTRLVAHWLNA
jgi:antibiotic biosynthesis monooxygenase (ABM) superfamily enzyme